MVTSILMALGITVLLWFLYQGVKQNKDSFSSENINKSLLTLGVLALILIGLISFAVIMLR